MQPFTIHARALNVQSATKRFTVLAYTGGPMRIGGWELPVVINLARLKLGKSLIANLDHNQSRRVGHVPPDGVDNNGRELRLSGYLSATTRWRDEVLSSHQEGFRWQASVECTADDVAELAARKSMTVNGRTIHGPAYVTTSTLKGFAFCSHGADDETLVDIAASRVYLPRYDAPQIFSDRTINKITNWISR